jgi:hypothetical protein
MATALSWLSCLFYTSNIDNKSLWITTDPSVSSSVSRDLMAWTPTCEVCLLLICNTRKLSAVTRRALWHIPTSLVSLVAIIFLMYQHLEFLWLLINKIYRNITYKTYGCCMCKSQWYILQGKGSTIMSFCYHFYFWNREIIKIVHSSTNKINLSEPCNYARLQYASMSWFGGLLSALANLAT